MQKFSRKHKIVLASVVFSMLLSSFGYYFYQVLFSANMLVGEPPRTVIIQRGTSLVTLSKQLQEEVVLQEVISFSFVARLLSYDRNIRPGYYELQSNMGNLAAVRLLSRGYQKTLRLRFHAIRRLEELPRLIGKQLQLSEDTLLWALCSDSVARRYGFDQHNFALMFIPNTYEFYWTTDTKKFLNRMHAEYLRFWKGRRKRQTDSLGLTPIEVGILASIVQAETQKEEEKKRIAGVYLNRLRSRMRLDADPTIIFAWGDFSIRRVLNRHKKIRSPYNTYQHRSLPPGPINFPEITSIEAVLEAEAHDYLYFCAKDDFSGYHVFSKNLTTHGKYADRYRRALTQRQRKVLQK